MVFISILLSTFIAALDLVSLASFNGKKEGGNGLTFVPTSFRNAPSSVLDRHLDSSSSDRERTQRSRVYLDVSPPDPLTFARGREES